MKTAIVVLAAGSGSRMGQAKQLLPFRGSTLVRHAVLTALQVPAARVFVVTGAEEERVRGSLVDLPVTILGNPEWRLGMGSSIRAGAAAALVSPDVSQILLTLADMPMLTVTSYTRLLEAQSASGKLLVASVYSSAIHASTPGVPALFARPLFPELTAIPPGEAGKYVIRRNAEHVHLVPCPEAALDIDTPQDYAALLQCHFQVPSDV